MDINMTSPVPSGTGDASVSVDPLDESDVIAEMAAALQVVDEHEFRKAWLFSVGTHRGQLDKAGNDYFTAHVLPVTERAVTLAPPELKTAVAVAALLHDTVEDSRDHETPIDLDLIQAWFGCDARSDVDALTQRVVGYFEVIGEPEYERYNAYINRAISRPVSAIVKLADNLTNGDPARLAMIPNPQTRARLRDKYRTPRAKIRRAVRDHLMALRMLTVEPVAAEDTHENEMGDRR